jgi:hypothetical protein
MKQLKNNNHLKPSGQVLNCLGIVECGDDVDSLDLEVTLLGIVVEPVVSAEWLHATSGTPL